MNIKQLDAFLAVAESRSFTQAGRLLGLAQPTVTARIKALEQILDAPLLDRTADGARLTAAGRRLHSYASRIVRLSELAQTSVAEPAGHAPSLAIGAAECITTYRLVPLIEYLHLRHRTLGVSLRTLDDDPVALVREERVDCAFFIGPRPVTPDVRHHTLRRESLSLVAAPSHPLVGVSLGSAREFAASTVVCAHRWSGYQHTFESVLAATGEPAGGVLAVGSVDAVKRSVGEGIGIALLPTVVVRDELRDGLLGRIGWWPPFEVYSQCVWRRGLDEDPSFATVLDAARQVTAEDDPRGGAVLRAAC
ncbi:LysR family transcriptional regulator [Streptomyces sp. NPDC002795]|uniref:LysR family transcriptional regulator n=1 Tax=Streptomyces sp. NPDC002795 TaxID=3364665 RepID=UPI0036A85970